MKSDPTIWLTHDWISHRLLIIPGLPLLQQNCRNCGRDFVEEWSTGERYAVYISVFRFERLSDEVTSRWLTDRCPAKRLAEDDADRETRF
jgi:hypothetical protein